MSLGKDDLHNLRFIIFLDLIQCIAPVCQICLFCSWGYRASSRCHRMVWSVCNTTIKSIQRSGNKSHEWKSIRHPPASTSFSILSRTYARIKRWPCNLYHEGIGTLSSSNSHVCHSLMNLSANFRSLMSSETLRCVRPSKLCIIISAREDLPVPGVPVMRMFGGRGILSLCSTSETR